MLFKKDFGSDQFKKLSELYSAAREALTSLNKNYPQYADTWKIVGQKMELIKKTIDADEIPTDDMKREADITTMLNYELRDFVDDKLTAIYKLDSAYTLLGMKDIQFEMNNKMK
jgi:hypothetical protein